MAGIIVSINSVKAQLKIGMPTIDNIQIWNNQIEQLTEGNTYAFPIPSIFVEVVSPIIYNPIGRGYSQGDLTWKIHLLFEEYDAGDGNFEENTNVFVDRDLISKTLNSFQPSYCSSLMKVGEEMDNVHTNLYHHITSFICSYIDNTGSIDVQEENAIVEPPITLIVETDIVDHIEKEPNIEYRIPWLET